MNRITRKEAAEDGRLYYFTGKPCPAGHISKRFVSNRKCSACSAADDHKRYNRNHEREMLRSRKYQRLKLPTPTRPSPETCELCGKPPGKRALHLDHDHVTNQFRGWLCQNCNLKLGNFGDNIAGLQAAIFYLRRNTNAGLLSTDSAERKKIPLATGVLDYFPAALIEVAKVSYAGNQQHNPGMPLHWARSKSADQADTMHRHFIERGTLDSDGMRHSAKMCWRALAILQLEMEEAGSPIARGAAEL